MSKIKVFVVNKSEHALPAYETAGAAGLDLRAYIPNDYQLLPAQRILVPTGIFIAVPDGYEVQIRSRSGLAYKHGVIVLNAPGTIDSDYRGELNLLLLNTGNEVFTIRDGDRLGQMVLKKVEKLEFVEVKKLSVTERNEKGFGSTGVSA
jgi:dUTP pyrophosphatase